MAASPHRRALTEFDARTSAAETARQVISWPPERAAAETACSIADGAGHENRIARLAPLRNKARLPGSTSPVICTVATIAFTARRIAADERDVVLPRPPRTARRQSPPTSLVRRIQRQRKRHPARPRTHRGHVGEIDCDHAIADVGASTCRGKVDALDQRVDHLTRSLPRRRLQHRAVVADADDNPA